MHSNTALRHRVNRVINFVRNRESELLTLDTLADVACFSRDHFSRVFASHCSETPVGFASRIRLEQAVADLIYLPHKSITEVGLEAGFSSPRAFSNGFKNRYGASPRNFRSKNQLFVNDFPKNQNDQLPSLYKVSPKKEPSSRDQKVKICTMPEIRLAYIRHRGAYYNSRSDMAARRRHEMQAIRKKLIDWASTRGLWQHGDEVIGVCPDNSAVTPGMFCQYDQGIVVEDGVEEDQVVSIQVIPETTLAILEGGHTWREDWAWLLSDWLPRSGMKLADHTFYEFLKVKESSADYCIDGGSLCIPVSWRNDGLQKMMWKTP